MRKRILGVAILLVISLAIYLFYRTEATAVNTLVAALLGQEVFANLRHTVQQAFPLPSFAIYTLPEMLWTAAFTLLSGNLFVWIFRKRVACFWIPLLVSAGLELLQIIPSFPGRFDPADLLGATLAWAVSVALISGKSAPSQNLFGRLNRERLAFTGCYAIMYLAHVWR